jgi:hypothetical protein
MRRSGMREQETWILLHFIQAANISGDGAAAEVSNDSPRRLNTTEGERYALYRK